MTHGSTQLEKCFVVDRQAGHVGVTAEFRANRLCVPWGRDLWNPDSSHTVARCSSDGLAVSHSKDRVIAPGCQCADRGEGDSPLIARDEDGSRLVHYPLRLTGSRGKRPIQG